MPPPTVSGMSVTVDLPAAVLVRLRAEADRRGVSIDQVIAELVDRMPAGAPTAAGSSVGRRLSFAGTLSAEPELAETADEALEEIVRRTAG